MPRPRAALRALAPRHHGGVAPAGAIPDGVDIADFSVNINPFGPSPAVAAAFDVRSIAAYPDPEAQTLRSALAAELGLPTEWIVAVAGTAEAIWTLALAFLDPGDRALIVTPGFGEYAPAVVAAGGAVVTFPANPADGITPDPAGVARAVRDARPKLTFLCNPNNPTGRYWREPDVRAVLAAVESVGGLFALDEAYRPFVTRPWDSSPFVASGHAVLLRSLTKDLALAGLRLGYVVAHPAHTALIGSARPPWTVGGPAQAAGVAALGDAEHHRRTLADTRRLLERLVSVLREAGLDPLPTATNFCLVPVENGAVAKAALLRHGILVRDCASFGLPGHIRLAARPETEIDRLAAALRAEGIGGG